METFSAFQAVDECEINLPFITESEDGPLHLIKYLRRSEFENLIKKDVESTLEICARALQNASLRISDTPWFVREHRVISEKEWKLPAVKTRSNCSACHGKVVLGD